MLFHFYNSNITLLLNSLLNHLSYSNRNKIDIEMYILNSKKKKNDICIILVNILLFA